MYPTLPAESNLLSLDEVLSRLQQHELVVAILLMGSTGEGSLTPSSDYDLCLVLSELPAPAKLVTTWINGRLAEVYITTADAVRRASAEPEKWVAGSEEEALIRWLRSGRVIFDRAGLMEIGQAKARRAPIAVPHESSKYWAWWGIGYNVAHMRRYAASEDATSRAAAQVRLLWSVFQVFAHYFTIREIPWRGEKEAINYLTSNDPAFLDLLNQCIDEHDIQHKAFLYEELAKMTLAPVGGLWTSGQTTVELGPGFGTGDTAKHDEPGISAEAALDFWHQLTRDTTR